MSYENAPATRLIATHCVACGRPLVDSESVEAGMGPDCRERHGYYADVSPEARADANARVHALATGTLAPAQVAAELVMIRALGFDRLADKLESRLVVVEIAALDASTIAVVTPYAPAFVDDLKATLSWRKWDGENKRWIVPAAQRSKNALWALIRRHFAGSIGRGPQGLFPIVAEGRA